jgi:hypothetical protein
MNRMAFGLSLQLLDDAFQALLKVAAVLGASEQRSHVQRIDVGLGQNLRDIALNNSAGQSFGNGGFADTRLTHQQADCFCADGRVFE